MAEGKTPAERFIPYERHREVTKQLNDAKARIADLEKVAASTTDATERINALEAKLAEARAAAKAQAETWDTERAMITAGLTDDLGREVAMLAYKRTPEEGRKPLNEWLAEVKAAPDQAPAALRPYFTAPAAETPAAPAASTFQAAAQRATPPASTAPARQPAATPVTAAALTAATERAAKSGSASDWDAVRAMRSQMLAANPAGS